MAKPMNSPHQGFCVGLAKIVEDLKPKDVLRALFADSPRFSEGSEGNADSRISRYWKTGPKAVYQDFMSVWADGRPLPVVDKSVKKKADSEVSADDATRTWSADDEQTALDACVNHLMSADGGVGTALCVVKDIQVRLTSELLPLIEQGLSQSRWHRSTIGTLTDDFNQYINGFNKINEDVARQIMARLVAAVVFGPDHALALSAESYGTLPEDEEPLVSGLRIGTSILLSRLYDIDHRYVGDSYRFEKGDMVFVGRYAAVGAYVDRLEKIPELEDVANLVDDRNPVVFKIATPEGEDSSTVSNLHGVVYFDKGEWRYADLESTNKSMVLGIDYVPMLLGSFGKGDASNAPGTNDASYPDWAYLKPGDKIVLGIGSRHGREIADAGNADVIRDQVSGLMKDGTCTVLSFALVVDE